MTASASSQVGKGHGHAEGQAAQRRRRRRRRRVHWRERALLPRNASLGGQYLFMPHQQIVREPDAAVELAKVAVRSHELREARERDVRGDVQNSATPLVGEV